MKSRNTHSIIFLFLFFLLCVNAFAQPKEKGDRRKLKMKNEESFKLMASFPLDTLAIERIMNRSGKSSKGEFKITIPQNDLSVEVDGFKIIPAMGLSTWVAFTPSPDGAVIMGDIVLTESDLQPVQREIIRQGLSISAIHNHFIRNHPNIMFMHLSGSGPTEQMAQKASAILEKIKEVRGADPVKGTASSESLNSTLDVPLLDGIIGYHGDMNKGVYKYTIGRPDIVLKEHGVPVSTFLGFNTWAAFQGQMDKAAVAGDFTMLEGEVGPVIKALVENGIEVVAVHNHMVHEQPRIFFLHYWGTGHAETLARGLRAALDQTNRKINNQEMKAGGH